MLRASSEQKRFVLALAGVGVAVVVSDRLAQAQEGAWRPWWEATFTLGL